MDKGVDFINSIKLTKIFFFLFCGVLFISLLRLNLDGSVTWDEPLQLQRTYNHIYSGFEFIFGEDKFEKLIKESSNLGGYGFIQKLPATIYASIIWFLRDSNLNKINFPFKEYYSASHFISLCFGFGTCLILYKSSKILKLTNPWIAPLLLISTPIFSGHSLFNIKDIPFAFFYTLFTCLSNDFYLRKNNKKSKLIFMLSCAGILTSLKIIVLPIISIQIFFYNVVRESLFFNVHKFFKTIIKTILYTLTIIIIAIILSPAWWHDPINSIYKFFIEYQNYPWKGCMNIDGLCVGKFYNSPVNFSTLKYIFNWSFIKLSILNISMIIISIITLTNIGIKFFINKTLSENNFIILNFGFQMILVPLAATIGNSNLYDGLRHLIFFIPPFCLIGSYALHKYYFLINSKLIKLMTCILISIILICNFFDTVGLAPYQYVYMNELSRNKHSTGITDLDYWGASLGELNNIANSNNLYLFPNDDGILRNFRLSNKVNKKTSDKKYTSMVYFRPPPNLNNEKKYCKKVAMVSRKYPITKNKVELSKLVYCINK